VRVKSRIQYEVCLAKLRRRETHHSRSFEKVASVTDTSGKRGARGIVSKTPRIWRKL
jgi:hypothetical protein